MNAWQAKEYGLIDVVIDDGKPGLVAPLADSSPPPRARVLGLASLEESKKSDKNPSPEEKPADSIEEKDTK